MAIDTTMFAADIPAAAYTAGDTVNLSSILGPANVRSGRGSAVLKKVSTFYMVTGNVYWAVHVKNSDWVDEVISFPVRLGLATACDEHSSGNQSGCNSVLTANSGWMVYAVALNSGTTTAANSLVALVDIDYPSVSAVSDPDKIDGVPTSIVQDATLSTTAIGSLVTAPVWKISSVDYFKAGFAYCLQTVECLSPSNNTIMGVFVAYSSAAGMGGLQRIIPCTADANAVRALIRYASKLVKGPMDMKVLALDATGGTSVNLSIIADYVKKAGN